MARVLMFFQFVLISSIIFSAVSCSDGDHASENYFKEPLVVNSNGQPTSQSTSIVGPWEFRDLQLYGAAKLSCPIGIICDASYDYHDYAFRNDQGNIYLAFKSQIVEGYSLDSFRKFFKYLWFGIELPDGFYWQSSPIEKINFTDWKNGVLFGSFEVLAGDKASSRSARCQGCCMGECDDFYKSCSRAIESKIINVEFGLKLPDRSVIKVDD